MKQLLLFFCLLPLLLSAQQTKVVGYLPYYRFGLKDQIQYEKLTHLNLSFLNPDLQGNLSIGNQDIDPVVAKAKLANPDILVLVALAGGALTPEWEDAYDHFLQAQNRSGFIHLLMEYVETHQLDGMDVDLEWSHVNSLYSPFVLELKDSLDAHDKLMTAALPGTYRYPEVSDAAMNAFAWINLMAYDLTGSWAPNNPGPHSPYSFAQQSITYWTGQGLTKERMTLGVPFYGYDFDQAPVSSFTYGSMVAEDTAYAQLDQVGQRYYNGMPTIRAKTLLGQSETAGIMIWELGQDAFGAQSEYSLLTVIDETLNGLTSNDPILGEADWTVYPNPAQDFIQLRTDRLDQNRQMLLRDLQGRMLLQTPINPTNNLPIDISQLPTGIYLVELWNNDRLLGREKLIRGNW
ncbi:MAG: glycosyl hydrolase family 18 protein [Bacteroidota bacterium]